MKLSPYAAPGILYPTKLTIEIVIDSVSAHFGCSNEIVFSNSRKTEIIDVRNAAIYLCRMILHKTYHELAAYFEKDHATIMNSCKRVLERLEIDEDYQKNIKSIKEIIRKTSLGL